MFNNMDMTNVVTNTNDEDVTICPRYYTIGEFIAMLNIMTDTTFSISTMATNYGCISIQSPYSIDFTYAPDIRAIIGLERWTVILFASFCGSNVIQVYFSLVRSSDLKIAIQNNNLLTTIIISNHHEVD